MKLKKLNQLGFDHIFVMVFVMLAIGVGGTYLLVSSFAATPIRRSSHIVDVSWPNCPGVKASYGVVGLNNGKPFTVNPCLKKEVRHINHESFYVNSRYNGQHSYSSKYPCHQKTKECGAYNYGYANGLNDLKIASRSGAYSNLWWIDVEEGVQGNTWGPDQSLNVQYLKGLMDAIASQGIPHIGFYAPASHWQRITGGWKNNHPSWSPTGGKIPVARAAALGPCGTGFTGGPVWLVQYIDSGLDVNLECNSSFKSSL